MKKLFAVFCILALCLATLTGCVGKVESEPMDLTLIYGDTEVQVMSDEFDEKRTEVTTVDASLPGTTKEYTFTGVTLADLMEMAGVEECSKAIVNSTDGYSTEVAAADIAAYDIMITDGYTDKAIPADAGGPIKLVFPATEYPELNDTYDAWSWQWYVGSVEFVD